MQNPFENALLQLSRATSIKPFDKNLLLRLSAPERETTINIPVEMDDGRLELFEGYRVQHSSVRGPYKGGVRFHPDTDINEVRALAFWMTMKTAVAGIPMGGGKGGVTVDPKKLSATELQRLSRGWVQGLLPLLGPKLDIPAPDVGTTPEIIGYMADAYAEFQGDTTGAAFTGKPLEKGGSEGRSAATGMGGYFAFEALHGELALPQSCTVAIQGMGNVGGYAMRIFAKHGHTIVAISDSKHGIYNKTGLNIQEVEQYKKENGTFEGYKGAKQISNANLLELPVDVLIPAALENQITAENAAHIQSRIIVELANGPTTTEADDILLQHNIPIVPDILANAGGVIVSTFEWEQNLKGERWTEEQVNTKLREIMCKEAAHVHSVAKKYKTDLRRAAFIVALERLEEAYKN